MWVCCWLIWTFCITGSKQEHTVSEILIIMTDEADDVFKCGMIDSSWNVLISLVLYQEPAPFSSFPLGIIKDLFCLILFYLTIPLACIPSRSIKPLLWRFQVCIMSVVCLGPWGTLLAMLTGWGFYDLWCLWADWCGREMEYEQPLKRCCWPVSVEG